MAATRLNATPLVPGSSASIRFVFTNPPRTVIDGATTANSTTVTSQTAYFSSADVGRPISGSGVPSGTTIQSVTNVTTAVMSAQATLTATNVGLTIGGELWDPASVTCSLEDPTNATTTPSAAKLQAGVYSLTQTFATGGANPWVLTVTGAASGGIGPVVQQYAIYVDGSSVR